jgi:mannosyltransferase OCH1-like enzyme
VRGREVIPRILHYCWYGSNPLPDEMTAHIEGWRRQCPNYAIRRWDETNSPLHIGYVKRALELENWANASNYVRLFAVHQAGGIYLDTDVELLKSFDGVRSNRCFFGWQNPARLKSGINNAVFGAEKGHPFVRQLMDELLASFDGSETADLSSPRLVTRLLMEKGLTEYVASVTDLEGITLYPRSYFYPYLFNEEFSPECLTPDTCCIHHWRMSWVESDSITS